MEFSSLFQSALVILGVASFVGILFYHLKIPTVLAFLTTGVVIGPNALGLVESIPGTQLVSELALSLLLFTIGLEFNMAKLKQLKRGLLRLGLPQMIACVVVFFFLARFLFAFPFTKAFFVAFLVALSSTAIVLKLIDESREMNTPYAQNAVSILIFQDLAVLIMIVAFPLLAGSHGGESQGGVTLSFASGSVWFLKILGLLVGFWVVGRWVLPRTLSWVVRTRSRELFYFFLLFLTALSGYAMHALGLSFALGAFIAGLMVAESPFEKQANTDFAPLRDLFMGLFFVSIGMLLDPFFVVKNFFLVAGLLILILVIKAAIIALVVRVQGFPKSISMMTGLILFQVGEFSFVLAGQGRAAGILDQADLQVFLSLSITTLALTPYAYRYGPKISFQERFSQWIPQRFSGIFKVEGQKSLTLELMRKDNEKKDLPSFQTLIVGYGIAGQNLAHALKSLEIPYKIMESNANTVESFRSKEPIHFADATRKDLLEQMGIEEAKVVVLTVSGVAITERIIDSIRHLRPDIRIIIRTAYIRDVDTIGRLENVDWVVGEIETSLEILSRTLRVYGVSSEKIHDFLMQSRDGILSDKAQWNDSIRRNLELPTWEALSAMRPFKLEEEYTCIGKTLAELELTRRTGVAVVIIFREGQGTRLPAGDYECRSGDTLYLLGSDDAMAKTQEILSKDAPPVDTPSPESL